MEIVSLSTQLGVVARTDGNHRAVTDGKCVKE